MPPVMMIELAHSTIISPSASMRSLVRKVSGRNIAKTSAFHTHSHLPCASIGKSAVRVV